MFWSFKKLSRIFPSVNKITFSVSLHYAMLFAHETFSKHEEYGKETTEAYNEPKFRFEEWGSWEKRSLPRYLPLQI